MCGRSFDSRGKGNVDAAPGGEVANISHWHDDEGRGGKWTIGSESCGRLTWVVSWRERCRRRGSAGMANETVDGEGAQGWQMKQPPNGVGGNGKMAGVAEMEGVLGRLHTLWRRWRLKQLPQTSSRWVGWSMIHSRVIYGGTSGMLGGRRNISIRWWPCVRRGLDAVRRCRRRAPTAPPWARARPSACAPTARET